MKELEFKMHDNMDLYEIVSILEMGIDAAIPEEAMATILIDHHNPNISIFGYDVLNAIRDGHTIFEALITNDEFPKTYANICHKARNYPNPYTLILAHIEKVAKYRDLLLTTANNLKESNDVEYISNLPNQWGYLDDFETSN